MKTLSEASASPNRKIPADYAQRLRKVEVHARLISEDLMAGLSPSIFKGRGMDFVDVREYTPGDDVRLIDWNVSGRLRKTYIKRLVEERELTVLLLVDLSASGHFGTQGSTKRELLAELAGSLALSALRQQARVGLLLFTETVEHYLPPRKTRPHVQRLLRDLLLHVPQKSGTDIRNALNYAARVTHRPALIFLLSDLHDRSFETACQLVNHRHELMVLQVVDPREHTLPNVGLARISDPESGEHLELDTSNPEVQTAYEAAFHQRQDLLKEQFRKAGIGHLELSTARPWTIPLRTFLNLHARRRIA